MEQQPVKRVDWSYHTQQQKASTLSVAAYCKAQGLCKASFYNNRNKINNTLAPKHPLLSKSSFIEINPPVSVQTPSYTIRLQDNIEIHISDCTNIEHLAHLITLLRRSNKRRGLSLC